MGLELYQLVVYWYKCKITIYEETKGTFLRIVSESI